jgi:hypothetical protein
LSIHESGQSEFAGLPNVEHVADSQRPFAAIMAAVSRFSVEAVQRTLDEADIPQPDETLGKIRLESNRETVTVTPIPLRGADGPVGILDRIMEQLDEGEGVALYHKTDRNPDSPYGWTLLSGFEIDEYEMPGAVEAIDPRHDQADYLARYKVLEIIRNSTFPPEKPSGMFARATRKVVDYLTGADLDSVPAHGIFAYAVDPQYIHSPVALIFKDEEKHEPAVEPTYSATGQDKVVWPKPDAVPDSAA